MKLVLVEQPTDEIISLKETKNYLRIDHDFDDDLLKMLINQQEQPWKRLFRNP